MLPAGPYEVGAFNFATRSPDPKALTIRPGATTQVPLTLEPTRITSLDGKQPPVWHALAARGLPRTAKPADFRGKWLLLDFWGFW